MRSKWLLVPIACLLALPPAAGACSSENDCTLLQCIDDVNVYLHVELSADAMRTSTIKACRNDVCSIGQATSLPTFAGDRQKVFLTGDLTADTTLDTTAPGTSYTIDVTIPIDGATLEAGADRYEIHVLDPIGADVSHISDVATYEESHPNGADCPTTCTTAIIGTP
ncbi:MAG TPA: hypothetical protein VNO21_25430 [Polyangiaceae bacterium]|nr:hypothetical protein [Polyangiaceae bacterium]